MQNNDLINELGTNFIEYAYAVNTDRAIPDATCGLKPVARRILWSAFENGRLSSKNHVKSAKICGEVMGNYHPHGDSSIYGAMIRLSQDWIMRYPLIDIHGNKGNIGGDGPAAARYTEAKLERLAEDGLLNGIKKRNVDFIPNYSEDMEEPVTLPSAFPNLLCNPNSGIGVAMACNWLPHNLTEVAQAIYDYMDGKEPTLPGPDFPTGGVIINKNDIPAIMATGHGSIKVRGKYKIEKQNLVFYEVPYGVSTESLMTEIGEICDAKEIEGITNLRNESNGDKGLRIVIECEKGLNLDSIAQKLFLKTNLQSSISYNQVALVDKTPTELNLKDCVEIYVKHNINCLVREINFDLTKAKARLHIVDGLLIALEDIDNVIALIKGSSSAAAAKDNLMNKYNLSEEQAKAILDMKLSKLAKLEKVELENEKKELVDAIAEYNAILSSEDRQKTEVRERLSAIVKRYGDARRTTLEQIDVKPEEKEIIAVTPEDVVVIMTQKGDIKRITKSSFKTQRKGGKGVKTEDDAILDTISTNTIDNLLLFTNKGLMYKLLVDKIPVGTNASKGNKINTLINLEPDERVIAITSLDRQNNNKFVMFTTKQGLVKKTYLNEYTSLKKSTGAIAIKLKDGDSIANIELMDEEDMVIITKNGMSIRFETKDINPIGRATAGVKGIKLADDDEVLTSIALKNNNAEIAVFSTQGLGKKVALSELSPQTRGGKGIYIYKGEVAGAELVSSDDQLLLVGKTSICISATDIPSCGRTAQGNIMIKGNINSIVKL